MRQHIFGKLLANTEYIKIAAPGEGRKPSCEQYIAESEFALLGILSKEHLMIHFFMQVLVSNTKGSRNNKHFIF